MYLATAGEGVRGVEEAVVGWGRCLILKKKQQWGWVVRPWRHEGLRGHGVTRLFWDHYGLDLDGVTRFGHGRQLFFFFAIWSDLTAAVGQVRSQPGHTTKFDCRG